jgi:hypothetical protein
MDYRRLCKNSLKRLNSIQNFKLLTMKLQILIAMTRLMAFTQLVA